MEKGVSDSKDLKVVVEKVLADLNTSDAQMARVTEDLISLLINKNIILFTDLPSSVQEKLLHRESLREQLREPVISIVSDADTL